MHATTKHNVTQLHPTNWTRKNTLHQPLGTITNASTTNHDGPKHKDNRRLANTTKAPLHIQTDSDSTKHHWSFIFYQPRQTEK